MAGRIEEAEEDQDEKVEAIALLRSCVDPVIERHSKALRRRWEELKHEVRVDLGLESDTKSA